MGTEQTVIQHQNQSVSVLKGIGIILMVVGHSGCPKWLDSFIYLFHMPIFFWCSGYLFKEFYVGRPILFTWKKIEGLYWPFVKWSLIFLVLHNIFYFFDFYPKGYSLQEMFEKALRIILFSGSEQLLGGFWFLKELFFASLICLFLVILCRRIPIAIFQPGSWKGSVMLSLFLLTAALVVSLFDIKIPAVSHKTLLASSIYMAGLAIKQKGLLYGPSLNTIFFGCLLIGLVFGISFVFQASMSIQGWGIIPYFAIALTGIYGCWIFSHFLKSSRLFDCLCYVGDSQRTLYILIFHFLSFKVISALKMWSYGEIGGGGLSSFPVIGMHNEWYWMLYSVAGVIIPLVFLSINNIVVAWIKERCQVLRIKLFVNQ